MQLNPAEKKNNYLIPLILVTSLFFLWGLAYGLLDVLMAILFAADDGNEEITWLYFFGIGGDAAYFNVRKIQLCNDIQIFDEL